MNKSIAPPKAVNRTLSGFLLVWFWSFPWKQLLLGLPFLLVCIFFANLFMRRGDEGRRQQFLQGQLKEAFAEDDFETARLVLHRQLQSNSKNIEARFRMGQVLDSLGRQEEAVRVMRQLAFPEMEREQFLEPLEVNDEAVAKALGQKETEKETTDPSRSASRDASIRKRFRTADSRAARWLIAKYYVPRFEKELSQAERSDFMDLLDWLYMNAPKDLEIARLYAGQLMLNGRLEEALPVMVQLMPTSPVYGIQAAVLARQAGFETRAVSYAENSLNQFIEIYKKDSNRSEIGIAIAKNYVFLNQYERATSVLNFAIGKATEAATQQELRQHLGDCYVLWAESINLKPVKTTEDRVQILKLLESALTNAPGNDLVMQMVSDQVLETINESNPEIAALQVALVRGVSPGVSHFIRGTGALLKGNSEAAVMHLEIAAKTLPQSDVILNNLACVIAKRQDGDWNARCC
jgi:Flp pilus assembly protein TadD